MDPAQEIELHAKRYHKPMDELIARGDSPVQQFYSGATVFVTGGSGFLGKQLIEKLFRSCPISKLYLLTRQKNKYTIKDRLQRMLKEPVFDRLREQQPQFADKIVPVEGDVADIKLGLSDDAWTMLTDEVNIIFHEAATIAFNEPLRKATLTNVRGTREVVALAKQCKKFKKLVHVSTAFSHATHDRINTDVHEQFYPCPVPPDVMIGLAEDVEESRLHNITKDLIKGWPNTYTFTKAIAEELVRTSAGDLPVCVIRPSIVLPAIFEPNPGWVDLNTVIGPTGIVLGAGLGILRVILADVNAYLPMAPVDYVNNATIAAAWDSTEREKNGEKGLAIYNIAKNLQFGLLVAYLSKHRKRVCSPATVWHASTIFTKSTSLYSVLSTLFHFIPAYLMDIFCKILGKEMPKELPSFVSICSKLDKFLKLYNYFLVNDWHFKDNNINLMVNRMSGADRTIFHCDVSKGFDLKEYILVWAIGIRKYVIKDELKNTVQTWRKQKIYKLLHYPALAMYLYTLYYVNKSFFSIIRFLISCVL